MRIDVHEGRRLHEICRVEREGEGAALRLKWKPRYGQRLVMIGGYADITEICYDNIFSTEYSVARIRLWGKLGTDSGSTRPYVETLFRVSDVALAVEESPRGQFLDQTRMWRENIPLRNAFTGAAITHPYTSRYLDHSGGQAGRMYEHDTLRGVFLHSETGVSPTSGRPVHVRNVRSFRRRAPAAPINSQSQAVYGTETQPRRWTGDDNELGFLGPRRLDNETIRRKSS